MFDLQNKFDNLQEKVQFLLLSMSKNKERKEKTQFFKETSLIESEYGEIDPLPSSIKEIHPLSSSPLLFSFNPLINPLTTSSLKLPNQISIEEKLETMKEIFLSTIIQLPQAPNIEEIKENKELPVPKTLQNLLNISEIENEDDFSFHLNFTSTEYSEGNSMGNTFFSSNSKRGNCMQSKILKEELKELYSSSKKRVMKGIQKIFSKRFF